MSLLRKFHLPHLYYDCVPSEASLLCTQQGDPNPFRLLRNSGGAELFVTVLEESEDSFLLAHPASVSLDIGEHEQPAYRNLNANIVPYGDGPVFRIFKTSISEVWPLPTDPRTAAYMQYVLRYPPEDFLRDESMLNIFVGCILPCAEKLVEIYAKALQEISKGLRPTSEPKNEDFEFDYRDDEEDSSGGGTGGHSNGSLH